MRRSVRGKYQIAGPTLCASAPSHRSHAMLPRRTRNSDRPRASDRTMVATESNRLPSFKSRRTLSLLENEPRERKSHPEKNLSSDREPSANSGLDIETKNLSATGRGRTFFVDIPFYRTTYLKVRRFVSANTIFFRPVGNQSGTCGLADWSQRPIRVAACPKTLLCPKSPFCGDAE